MEPLDTIQYMFNNSSAARELNLQRIIVQQYICNTLTERTTTLNDGTQNPSHIEFTNK
jgi:hypothetical protein